MIGYEVGKKEMRLKGTGLQETLSKHSAGKQLTIGQAEAQKQCMLRCLLQSHPPNSLVSSAFASKTQGTPLPFSRLWAYREPGPPLLCLQEKGSSKVAAFPMHS